MEKKSMRLDSSTFMTSLSKFNILPVLIIFVSLFLSGCGLAETFNETVSLRKDILDHYGNEGSLGVQYSVSTGNGKSIKIEWENSSAFSPNDPHIEDKTSELAVFVRDHYEGIDKVDKVWIILTESRNIAIINTSRTVSYVYDIDELVNTEKDK
jgi:hypothetical protein